MKTRLVSNNTAGILCLILIVVSINSTYTILKAAEPTGYATSTSARVTFCISALATPTFYLSDPANSTDVVISGTYNLTAYLGPQPLSNDSVTFYYDVRNETKPTLTYWEIPIGTHEYEIGNHFIKPWDTTNVPDGNCNYALGIAGIAVSDCTWNQGDSSDVPFSINNINVSPTWSDFNNSQSTDFSSYTSWVNIENATITNPSYGSIDFYGAVNFDNLDMDNYITFSANRLRVSTYAYCLFKEANVTLYDVSVVSPAVYDGNIYCEDCDVLDYSHVNYTGNVTFRAPSLRGKDYTIRESAAFDLNAYSQTEINITRYRNQDTTIYAEISLVGTRISMPTHDCTIRFEENGTWGSYEQMNLNLSSRLHEYHGKRYSLPGIYDFSVRCDVVSDTLSDAGTINISNRPPALTANLPDATWLEDTTLVWYALDDYFHDPEGDPITYTHSTVPSITLSIDSTTSVVTFVPQPNWYGNRSVLFYATDTYNDTATSNLVTLTVIDTPEIVLNESASGSGGGSRNKVICSEMWECGAWGVCLSTGIQKRDCIDLMECGTFFDKPNETQSCIYTPTCDDSIKNGNETGVDCGGDLCLPCPTCSDGIKNQGEQGLDCGGPCPDACPSCNDGIKNGDEEETDCGGSCKPCAYCTDGIQNYGETDVDCGGPCDSCGTCDDGIKNNNEEGIDCGGPCENACILEQPTVIQKSSFLPMLLLILCILIALTLATHKQIEVLIHKTTDKLRALREQKTKMKAVDIHSAEENYLAKLKEIKNVLASEDSEAMLNEIFIATRNYFSNVFDIKYVFTKEELTADLNKEGYSKAMVSLIEKDYSILEETRFTGASASKQQILTIITNFEKLAVRISLEKLAISGESVLSEISLRINTVRNYLKIKKINEAKIEYGKTMEIYKRLNKENRAKAYGEIKKIYAELIKAKPQKKHIEISKKALLFVAIFLSALFLSTQIDPTITGFVINEGGSVSLNEIPVLTAYVGERFVYSLDSKADSKVRYSSNSRLFSLKGTNKIDFVPKQEDVGTHKIILIVDNENNMDWQKVVLNVKDRFAVMTEETKAPVIENITEEHKTKEEKTEEAPIAANEIAENETESETALEKVGINNSFVSPAGEAPNPLNYKNHSEDINTTTEIEQNNTKEINNTKENIILSIENEN